ncbi:MAG: hypothetical protein M1837_000745 [Sclerophora amabilis]|nr:MAG: hypothetical protein M1837_000745 [Sclerophora amabilis]
MTGSENDDSHRRRNRAPYTSHHPVPTIGRHERHQEQRDTLNAELVNGRAEADQDAGTTSNAQVGPENNVGSTEGESNGAPPNQGGRGGAEDQMTMGTIEPAQYNPGDPQSINNEDYSAKRQNGQQRHSGDSPQHQPQAPAKEEATPKEKRKQLHHMDRDHREREVTDPVTHLPVTIHDVTNKELEHAPENLLPGGSTSSNPANRGQHAMDGKTQEEHSEIKRGQPGMEKLFPPPSFETTRAQMTQIHDSALKFGVVALLAGSFLIIRLADISGVYLRSFNSSFESRSVVSFAITGTILVLGLGALGGGSVWVLSRLLENKFSRVWHEVVWDAERRKGENVAESHTPESTEWLNSILASMWQIINPDLFTSLADTLEDVMQASLPRMVRMISVEDLGQGSEALRILGIRWLPSGAAASSVSVSGGLEPSTGTGSKQKQGRHQQSDRAVQGEGEIQGNDSHNEDDTQDEESIAEGMEGEEGDFLNVEVAFSYRARPSGKSLRSKAKNAHLYLAFYLPGGIRFPVWVELKGIAGTMRMRLQLTPDPPFFALCTLTFLGQPKADLSCVPLTKKGLNIMDLPIISNFVQSSVDAAMAEYVAPKSLTLDLKDMVVGDGIKKDVSARGILVVIVKRAFNFKEGDGGLPGFKKGSSDSYVTVGWSKFGKPLWSTRIILEDMRPIWDETAFILVGPEELNAEERLKLQLWDSDRSTADDNLGQIEADLKELMQKHESKGKMHDRRDRLRGVSDTESMPGEIEWSVGYFAKNHLLPEQYSQQTYNRSIESYEQLKQKVSREAEQKLREATDKDAFDELSQQKSQDMHNMEVGMIASCPPSERYPSGIFSIQIHQIMGLELEQKNKSKGGVDTADEQDGNDLPSSYCTVILNHQPVFRTRTKPKNANPFFNAGTERFIRDWKSAEVMISIRDSRVHEDDPLLGIVYIPLRQLFRKRAQIEKSFPLAGGIGYGRVRISMVFRSVQFKARPEMLGWEYGTLVIPSNIECADLGPEYTSLRLKLRTSHGKGKMFSSEGSWKSKNDKPLRLAVQKRHSSCLVVEFRKNQIGLDKTPAYAIFWLKDIADNDEQTLEIPVWKGDSDLKRAQSSCETELGLKIGHIKVPLRFERGLSSCHSHLISKNHNLQDVSEALQCANESKEVENVMDDDDGTSSSSSDSSSDGDDGGKSDLQDDGKRGPIDQIRDYRDHQSELHRRHRGIMQWKVSCLVASNSHLPPILPSLALKLCARAHADPSLPKNQGPRTARWMRTKLEHGKEHIADTFHHRSRSPGIETEV